MTAAERMRRHRARKRAPKPDEASPGEALYRLPVEKFASAMGHSVRQYYYIGAVNKHEQIRWDDDVLNGKYGKVGMAFLAEVCTHGGATAQRAVQNRIKKAGAAAGRRLWLELCQKAGRWDLIHRYVDRLNRQRLQAANGR